MGIEARQLGERAGLEQMSRSQGYADASAKRVKKSVNLAAGCVANCPQPRFCVFPIAAQPSRYHFQYRCRFDESALVEAAKFGRAGSRVLRPVT